MALGQINRKKYKTLRSNNDSTKITLFYKENLNS